MAQAVLSQADLAQAQAQGRLRGAAPLADGSRITSLPGRGQPHYKPPWPGAAALQAPLAEGRRITSLPGRGQPHYKPPWPGAAALQACLAVGSRITTSLRFGALAEGQPHHKLRSTTTRCADALFLGVPFFNEKRGARTIRVGYEKIRYVKIVRANNSNHG